MRSTSSEVRSARRFQWKHNPIDFIKTLPKSLLQTLNQFIWCDNNWKDNHASRGYIGKRLGKSERTITRHTNTLHELGLMPKEQEHMQTNKYRVSPIFKTQQIKKALKYLLPALMSFNISLLSVQKREICSTSKIRHLVNKKCVTPCYTPLFSYSYVNNNLLLRGGDRLTAFQKRKLKLETVKRMLAKERRDYISERKDHPRAKEALLSPAIYNMIVTPAIKTIQDKLALSDREMLKCVAFSNSALEWGLKTLNYAREPRDPAGLFFSAASKYANVNGKPDWGWYRDVCYILGIEPFDEKDLNKAPIDKESQPRYQQDKIPQQEKRESIPSVKVNFPYERKQTPNRFLAMFGVPAHIKENDTLQSNS